MHNRGFIVLAMLALTGFALALLAGHGPWSGPELLSLSPNHGLNLGDLPVIVVWVIVAGAAWWEWRRR